ncbi:MAG: hypothetical protein HYY20_05895 [Candidatus Tectomicrobia bacterium]|uniref:Uncharacterized protein n=1 Tax=Tectimicrobiota bacterium TaxID=2528274 RepID=A0A932CNI5_UNCTE|nr:hypothetical protein [Candidatus Tectomicrobia bacterium]
MAERLADLIPGLYGGDGLSLFLGGFPHSVDDDPIAKINQLGEHIASEISLFPFSSSVGGFTFVFEKDLGTFVRTREPLGPLFAERAPTLGRGRLTLNLFSFTHFRYDEFDGESLHSLQRVARLNADMIFPNNQRDLFELDTILLNLGYELNLEHRHKNSLRYALGFDAGTPGLTLAGDVLGSHELNGDGVGDDIVTASLGVKWNPWGRLLLSGNVQLPLNREGLRSNLIATFGVEYAF